MRITSSAGAFRSPKLALQTIAVITRADAMGLIPESETIETLDSPMLRSAMRHISRAGIGRSLDAALGTDWADDPARLGALLEQVSLALEESPTPEFEWKRLTEILGPDLLGELVGVSPASLRRYRAAARTTPDPVAARLHLLAMITGDLKGAYNDAGIRQWFGRKRVQLGGRAPSELLTGEWDPQGKGATQVRELARSLSASPLT